MCEGVMEMGVGVRCVWVGDGGGCGGEVYSSCLANSDNKSIIRAIQQSATLASYEHLGV